MVYSIQFKLIDIWRNQDTSVHLIAVQFYFPFTCSFSCYASLSWMSWAQNVHFLFLCFSPYISLTTNPVLLTSFSKIFILKASLQSNLPTISLTDTFFLSLSYTSNQYHSLLFISCLTYCWVLIFSLTLYFLWGQDSSRYCLWIFQKTMLCRVLWGVYMGSQENHSLKPTRQFRQEDMVSRFPDLTHRWAGGKGDFLYLIFYFCILYYISASYILTKVDWH